MELLDTDVLIDVLRGHQPAVDWFGSQEELPHVPGFVVMELIQDADRKQRVQLAMDLVEPLPVVWPTARHCDRALEEFKRLHLSHRLGLLDSLIAASALGYDATLLTFNVKHYRAVEGLSLRQPYVR